MASSVSSQCSRWASGRKGCLKIVIVLQIVLLLSMFLLYSRRIATSAAQGNFWQSPPPYSASAGARPDADGKYTIESEGIRAQFIPYGASLTNLYIKDALGAERDIVVGFDNATYYSIDKSHPHLGGVPGRYANRIKNSTFNIDGVTYKVTPNENGGKNTLHGGPNGWDWRNFTVVKHDSMSITFSIVDPDGSEGFPGEVVSYVTYSVSPFTWRMKMTATATKKTPIMLSSHVYWNLDGFQNPDTDIALNHTLSLPFSGHRVEVDGILIPTGNILINPVGSVNDFWSKPKQIGTSFGEPEIVGNCGSGCSGYDNCWLVDREPSEYNWRHSPVASLRSDWSGIQVDFYSNQDAIQVYSCNGQDGTLALKRTQGFFDNDARPRVVQKYGCIVMEVEDWIDGINNPAWQRTSKQIFGPDDGPYDLEGVHVFKVDHQRNAQRSEEKI